MLFSASVLPIVRELHRDHPALKLSGKVDDDINKLANRFSETSYNDARDWKLGQYDGGCTRPAHSNAKTSKIELNQCLRLGFPMYDPSLAVYFDWLTVFGYVSLMLFVTWQILVRSK